MRSVSLLLLLGAAAASPVGFGGRERFVGNGVNQVLRHHFGLDLTAGATNATTHFYKEAALDHFGSNAAQWRQRYYTDETHWCGEGCPIFLYIGGEGPQGPVSEHLLLASLAAKHGALMVALEHRYYGASQPTADMSTKNLAFLTSEQALADLARFIAYLTRYDPASPATSPDTASSPPLALRAAATSSKVVGFGGSYPGNLAAWARLKFPSLLAGTVASSAPVHAEYDYQQYAQVVGAALAYPPIGGSDACAAAAGAGVKALAAQLSATTPMGTSAEIPEALKPCAPLADGDDLATYEGNVFGNFQGAVQYNLEGRPPYVSDVCGALLATEDDDNATAGDDAALKALARATALFANQSAPFAERCIPSSWAKDQVGAISNITFDGEASGRQWIWQSCNEFGFFQTTSGAGHPFVAFEALGVAEAGAKLCSQAFGLPDYDGPNTLWANTNFGARDYQGTNVLIPNGNMDPWHALGLVNASDAFFESCVGTPCKPQATAASDKLVFIDGTAHCRDMYAPGIFDSAGFPDTAPVQWAHEVIAAGVARFLE